MTTFHLTDGTTIKNVTLYDDVRTPAVIAREGGPTYTVFCPAGHRYVPVAEVARIERKPGERSGVAWYDLPTVECPTAEPANEFLWT
jgi:hypothetical protein